MDRYAQSRGVFSGCGAPVSGLPVPAWDRFHKLETRFPARLALRSGGGLGLPLLAGHPGSRLRGAAVGACRTLPAAHGRVYRPVRRPVRRAGPCPEGGTGMAEGCGTRARLVSYGMLPGLVLHRFPLDYAGLGLHAVDARHPAGLGDRCVWARRPAGWLVLPLCGRDSPCTASPCASEALASVPGRFPCRHLSDCCLRRVFPLFCAFRPRRAVGILGAGQP